MTPEEAVHLGAAMAERDQALRAEIATLKTEVEAWRSECDHLRDSRREAVLSGAAALDRADKAETERDAALWRLQQAKDAIARVRQVLAERRAEVAEDEAENGPSSWSDAAIVTCVRVEEALREPAESFGLPEPAQQGEEAP